MAKTPAVTTKKFIIAKVIITTTTTLASQGTKPTPQMKNVAVKLIKTMTSARTVVKTNAFTKSQKNQTKVAVCQFLDAVRW